MQQELWEHTIKLWLFTATGFCIDDYKDYDDNDVLSFRFTGDGTIECTLYDFKSGKQVEKAQFYVSCERIDSVVESAITFHNKRADFTVDELDAFCYHNKTMIHNLRKKLNYEINAEHVVKRAEYDYKNYVCEEFKKGVNLC